MAATADVQECNGTTPGAWNTVTAAKFCTADNYNPGTDYPIPIPDTGTKRSYWKSHCLNFGGAFTEITNIKIYTDGGGFGTGILVYIGDETILEASYVEATGTESEDGDEMVASHSGITGKSDLFGFVEGTPMDVDAGPIAAPGRCKHVVLQMDVDDTASPGEQTPETITWQYDEV